MITQIVIRSMYECLQHHSLIFRCFFSPCLFFFFFFLKFYFFLTGVHHDDSQQNTVGHRDITFMNLQFYSFYAAPAAQINFLPRPIYHRSLNVITGAASINCPHVRRSCHWFIIYIMGSVALIPTRSRKHITSGWVVSFTEKVQLDWSRCAFRNTRQYVLHRTKDRRKFDVSERTFFSFMNTGDCMKRVLPYRCYSQPLPQMLPLVLS